LEILGNRKLEALGVVYVNLIKFSCIDTTPGCDRQTDRHTHTHTHTHTGTQTQEKKLYRCRGATWRDLLVIFWCQKLNIIVGLLFYLLLIMSDYTLTASKESTWPLHTLCVSKWFGIFVSDLAVNYVTFGTEHLY